jgi:hypothetical protein
MSKKMLCSACHELTTAPKIHELLNVPICENCYTNYHAGSFEIDEGETNEKYCRWCGEGEGGLLLCDNCPKSFCQRCLGNNFGLQEVERIASLKDQWVCVLCSPQLLEDLIQKNQWDKLSIGTKKAVKPPTSKPLKGRILPESKNIVCHDISRGREKIEIPVINEVDSAPAPLDFIYVNQPVVNYGIQISNNPDFLLCCTCTDGCRDPTVCECAKASGGPSYDLDGRLLCDKICIYECNYKCKCHVEKCKNRVVGKGPRLKLELFRCSDPNKGWGVRCKTDIPAGTYIADYLGELVTDKQAERHGLERSDEYLFNLDAWARDKAVQLVHDLGLKKDIYERPREYYMDAALMDKKSLDQYFDAELIDKLSSSGAIKRAQDSLHKKIHHTTDKKKKSHESSRSSDGHSQQQSQSVSFLETQLKKRKALETKAEHILNDRCLMEFDEKDEAYIIDAR